MKSCSTFVLLALLFVASTAQCQCTPSDAGAGYPFYHGVASGDATEHEVLIWTKVTPEGSFSELEVMWRMSEDSLMVNVVAQGSVVTNDEKNLSVKAVVTTLEPGTWYYYEFEWSNYISPRGRTRTLHEDNSPMSIAVFSCSNYERGYFNAYRDALEKNNFHAVIHVGDYFYEYAAGVSSSGLPDRIHEPLNELFTLDDYRTRHAQCCLDDDLRELSRQFPMYSIWDDHEFRNDCYSTGAWGHDENVYGPWEEREQAAKQAWFEWIPVRDNAELNIYRSFECGTLAKLIFTDTRMAGRSAQVSADSPLIFDTTRTIISEEQKEWLAAELQSDANWKVMMSSVMLSPHITSSGYTIDPDLWDGYVADRNWLLNTIEENEIENFIVVSGDYHSSRAMNIPFANYNDTLAQGSAGCEFTTCAVTSYPHSVGDIGDFMLINPHIKFIEQTHNGFMILHLAQDFAQAEWNYVNSVLSNDFSSSFGKRAIVHSGNSFVELSDAPSGVSANEILLLADYSSSQSLMHYDFIELELMNIFPNPTSEKLFIQFNSEPGEIQFSVYDLSGRVVLQKNDCMSQRGMHGLDFQTQQLSSGEYVLEIQKSGKSMSVKFVVEKN
ncbi:MAG: alkaline phosphatase D family protein [Flavobacteriales bacterium]|nr:alkaline phosphatase D family protein [Flavobacteriales bacterium]